MKKIISPGIYQHYKGDHYQVAGTATHSDTEETMVLYQGLYESEDLGPNPWFVRPKKVFLEMLKINGRRVPRFAPIDNDVGIKPRDLFWLGIFPFTIFMINYVFIVVAFDLIQKFFIDEYFHFFGGASIAFSSYYGLAMLEKRGKLIFKSKIVKLIIILALVALAAVLWEFFEFIMDIIYIPINQPSVEDTMKDFVLGILGGAVLSVMIIFSKLKNWLK